MSDCYTCWLSGGGVLFLRLGKGQLTELFSDSLSVHLIPSVSCHFLSLHLPTFLICSSLQFKVQTDTGDGFTLFVHLNHPLQKASKGYFQFILLSVPKEGMIFYLFSPRSAATGVDMVQVYFRCTLCSKYPLKMVGLFQPSIGSKMDKPNC